MLIDEGDKIEKEVGSGTTSFAPNTCTITIAGDNYENVAFILMAKKLHLSTQRYSQPYSLTWLNKRNRFVLIKGA